ncbi:hypothetical protein IC006_2194 [Sulfuracidifex tepidarius]|uniref:Uncharacterized protein n=1 Tax=Sulfuracidifex tepidarius TaxID=1294262 RepID=A0A510E562_9CREN|nr:hypothetical protein IC006_2194 [Sulfuracidifex tepidarius]BBG27644.1 hypothetical protein IC007_2198 [Sulfuracidifex tepidarius]
MEFVVVCAVYYQYWVVFCRVFFTVLKRSIVANSSGF